jgi:hypothetical protein
MARGEPREIVLVIDGHFLEVQVSHGLTYVLLTYLKSGSMDGASRRWSRSANLRASPPLFAGKDPWRDV